MTDDGCLIPNPQSLIPNSFLPPGSTIGILGGGQLGRMLAIAAAELGYHVHVYCPEIDAPASEVARRVTVGAYDDVKKLAAFAAGVDVVTYEFENIPAQPVAELAGRVPVRPDPGLLALSQHRLLEKRAVNALGIATAPFAEVRSPDDLAEAARRIGLPAVLKTCRMGYDGKGQWVIPHEGGDLKLRNLLPEIFAQGGDASFILEAFIPFRMEISVIVARDAAGNMRCYCPVQNIHKNHILSETIAPAPVAPEVAREAERIACVIAAGVGLVGIMAVEMFVTEENTLLVNELAPRPHNSGHWTIDACVTGQFTQAIRAICGLPLGSPERLCDARMLNLIGDEAQDWARYAAMPSVRLHLYGKKEARPGRKMGHVTLLEFPVASCR